VSRSRAADVALHGLNGGPGGIECSGTNRVKDEGAKEPDGPRAILRVPEVLMAIAGRRGGSSLVELCHQLKLPKTSLHRLLRTLEQGGFLIHQAGLYLPGPESFRLARTIDQAVPSADFPACARPALEWLASETGETVMLCLLSEQGTESIYVDVIESEAQLRFSVRTGNRRPLFSVAAGKAMLAFLPGNEQEYYLENTDFLQFTPETSRRHDMPALLAKIRKNAVVFDRNGIVDGASGIASPIFDREGQVFCAVSAAGPTDRMEAARTRIEAQVKEAAGRISRIIGFSGEYPPQGPEPSRA
jgi:DNA-binding IclR family transcriptional regulator